MTLLYIDIKIDPILFNLGPVEVGWHGVMVSLAVIAGIGVSLWLARGNGISKQDIYSFAPWAILGGIVGARLLHVIDFAGYYIDHPVEIFKFWHGLSIIGAILGGTVAAVIYTKVTRKSLAIMADTITPGLILASAVGRIGCIINGDVYGKPSTMPWSFVYHDIPGVYAQPLNTPLHPSPLYELIWCVVVLIIILKIRGKMACGGSLFLLFLILYFTGRFGIEFTRGVDVRSFEIGGWHTPHFFTLATVAICGWLLLKRERGLKYLTRRGKIEDI